MSDDPRAPDAGSRVRRLHRASGAIALATFVVVHVLVQASALGGQSRYDAIAGPLARMAVAPIVEALFVLAPLAIHVGCGLYLFRRGSNALDDERYPSRRLWVVQRASAAFALVFVVSHAWELRIQRLFLGLAPDGLYSTMAANLSSTAVGVPWRALFYVLGIAAIAIHLANGLHAGAAKLEPPARRRVRIATVALGLGIFVVGSATVIGLATGTRLLPGADDDSGRQAPPPCGSAVKQAPLKAPPQASFR